MAIYKRCTCRKWYNLKDVPKKCLKCGNEIPENYYLRDKNTYERVNGGLQEAFKAEKALQINNDLRSGKPTQLKITWIEYLDTVYRPHMEREGKGICEPRFRVLRAFKGFQKRLDLITPFDCDDFMKYVDNGERKRSTLNRFLHLLKGALTVAYNMRLITDHPARHIKAGKETKKVQHILTPREETMFLSECTKSSSPFLYHFAVIALDTGMRYSEILNLTWNNVKLSGLLNVTKTKNKEDREIVMTTRVRDSFTALHVLTGKYPYVFFNVATGKPMMSIRISFKRRAKKVGLNISPHSMRHNNITRLAVAGFTPLQIKEHSGHKTTRSLEGYVHIGRETKKDMMKVLEERDKGRLEVIYKIK